MCLHTTCINLCYLEEGQQYVVLSQQVVGVFPPELVCQQRHRQQVQQLRHREHARNQSVSATCHLVRSIGQAVTPSVLGALQGARSVMMHGAQCTCAREAQPAHVLKVPWAHVAGQHYRERGSCAGGWMGLVNVLSQLLLLVLALDQ